MLLQLSGSVVAPTHITSHTQKDETWTNAIAQILAHEIVAGAMTAVSDAMHIPLPNSFYAQHPPPLVAPSP